MLAWVAATTAGHTKRTTTNAIVMIGYAVGNAAGPQYWKAVYQPRCVFNVVFLLLPCSSGPCSNHIPWAILSACWFVTAILLLVTRAYLARENAKRDKEQRDSKYDDIYITEVKADGTKEEIKVDKASILYLPVCAGISYGITGVP